MTSRYIFFIDSIEKLNLKKDSSIYWAHGLKKLNYEVYFLFEEDFSISNVDYGSYVTLRNFQFQDDSHLESLLVTSSFKTDLTKGDVLLMRLDPPFDSRYLRYLWMLGILESKGVRISNSPQGILKYHEKLTAYFYKEKNADQIPSLIGMNEESFLNFVKELKTKGFSEGILKPLDLYQGIGVEKFSLTEDEVQLKNFFKEKVNYYQGPLIIQPFLKGVELGEIRSLFFRGQELGSILKVPPPGKFLANIAQGASYRPINLEENIKEKCLEISKDLLMGGIDLIAFDILEGKISEVNVTCPGLMVEVAKAHSKNLVQTLLLV
jgi:glutathione synthase